MNVGARWPAPPIGPRYTPGLGSCTLAAAAAGARAAPWTQPGRAVLLVALAAACQVACASFEPTALATRWVECWQARDARQLSLLFGDFAVLEVPEGGHARVGRADIAAYLRAQLGAAPRAKLEVVAARRLAGGQFEVVFDVQQPPREARRWVLHGWVREGGRFSHAITRAEWRDGGAGVELGGACSSAATCRGFARCEDGRCVLTDEPRAGGS